MTTVMDKETKNLMDHIEETSWYKPSARAEVQKFVDEGGMDNYVKVDGEYRSKDDIDGEKIQKTKNSVSKAFWIALPIATLTLAALIIYGVIPE